MIKVLAAKLINLSTIDKGKQVTLLSCAHSKNKKKYVWFSVLVRTENFLYIMWRKHNHQTNHVYVSEKRRRKKWPPRFSKGVKRNDKCPCPLGNHITWITATMNANMNNKMISWQDRNSKGVRNKVWWFRGLASKTFRQIRAGLNHN